MKTPIRHLSRTAASVRAEYLPECGGERVIAVGRVAVIACSLVAFLLDASSSIVPPQIVMQFMLGYLAYSLLNGVHVWLVPVPPTRFQIGGQALDAAFGLFIVVLTGGSSSPFFTYLAFPMIFATVRWGWYGALGVGLPTALGFGIVSIHDIVTAAPGAESGTSVVRIGYLLGLAGMLSYIGAFERRIRRDIAAVAAWTPPPQLDQTHAASMLTTAAGLVRAPRALVVWTERDRPGLRTAFLDDGEVTCSEQAGTLDELVAEPLRDIDFLCPDAGTPGTYVLCKSGGMWTRWQGGPPLSRELQADYAVHAVIAVGLRGEHVCGRLFLLDVNDLTSDKLMLAELVGLQLQRRLEDRSVSRRLAIAAAVEERTQLARDVHDSVLQCLTGIGLQLEASRRAVGRYSEEAERILVEAADFVRMEQRSLRTLVRQMQSLAPHDMNGDGDLIDRITALVLRIERQWNVRITVESPLIYEHFDALIPDALMRELYQLLQEALVNAARHAAATNITVSLGLDRRGVLITVSDDGRGFPFRGRYDLARLTELNVGPLVLRQRVTALDGELTIDSGARGARVAITIPLPAVPVST